jgi:hypothetical protein
MVCGLGCAGSQLMSSVSAGVDTSARRSWSCAIRHHGITLPRSYAAKSGSSNTPSAAGASSAPPGVLRIDPRRRARVAGAGGLLVRLAHEHGQRRRAQLPVIVAGAVAGAIAVAAGHHGELVAEAVLVLVVATLGRARGSSRRCRSAPDTAAARGRSPSTSALLSSHTVECRTLTEPLPSARQTSGFPAGGDVVGRERVEQRQPVDLGGHARDQAGAGHHRRVVAEVLGPHDVELRPAVERHPHHQAAVVAGAPVRRDLEVADVGVAGADAGVRLDVGRVREAGGDAVVEALAGEPHGALDARRRRVLGVEAAVHVRVVVRARAAGRRLGEQRRVRRGAAGDQLGAGLGRRRGPAARRPAAWRSPRARAPRPGRQRHRPPAPPPAPRPKRTRFGAGLGRPRPLAGEPLPQDGRRGLDGIWVQRRWEASPASSSKFGTNVGSPPYMVPDVNVRRKPTPRI